MGKFPWDAPEVIATTRCPVIPEYSPAQVKQMTTELRALQQARPGAVTPKMMRDYSVVRDRCRALSPQ